MEFARTMRAVITRVTKASVAVDGETVGAIENGFLVLLGVAPEDTEKEAVKLALKVINLRVFSDRDGKMNLDLKTAGGSLLIVPQFTLYADLASRRPGFTTAAKPDIAIPLYERFISECRASGVKAETGVFGAKMSVLSVNDGPVTIIMDTDKL